MLWGKLKFIRVFRYIEECSGSIMIVRVITFARKQPVTLRYYL